MYNIREDVMAFLNVLSQKKEKLDSLRPLPENSVKSLKEKLILDWTYHSNAIEGNTLTIYETKVVIENGITVAGKTLKEHLEVINHKEAILYLEELVKNNTSLSEWVIKSIHRLILKGIDDKNAGVYRKENVYISGASFTPPDYIQVPILMTKLVEKINNYNIHPIVIASVLHVDFVKIHPFVDGNGRTARLLMNLELMKSGYPIAIIPKEIRAYYYQTLDKACTQEDYNDFIILVCERVNNTFDLYFGLLGKV
ncbi:Fic family protein [Anaerocellum danielii]|uniref:Fic family protein n=1 Tax=Anaerocellum danielii TaxID=1387557 RepID=A0ABZ0U0W8_9FIRM|nr:Fic family protein [Caldicellulosiruptor danielii]WPX08358.1 Fic family protein [Caldicellulosiruptor danielii]